MNPPPTIASYISRTCAVGATVLALSLLGGCRVGHPFRGPGYDPDRGVVHPDVVGQVLVVITRGDIEAGGGRKFANELRAVLDSMHGQDGLVGYSVRKELLGSRVWTMSVWIDRVSVERFVNSPAHARAMAQGGIPRAPFVAAYTQIDVSRVPLSWREAERLLQTRTPQE